MMGKTKLETIPYFTGKIKCKLMLSKKKVHDIPDLLIKQVFLHWLKKLTSYYLTTLRFVTWESLVNISFSKLLQMSV